MAYILVADDEDSVREFVVRALTHGGHTVRGVADGLDALDALSEHRFDALVTDIVMPEMDGVALALKVSKDYPDLTVIMMSGYAAERQRAYNLDALIHRVVAKPFTLSEICEAVDAALAARPD